VSSLSLLVPPQHTNQRRHQLYAHNLLHLKQGERGYDVAWSHFIDNPINSTKLCYMQRGEVCSDSIKELSNAGRTLEQPIRNGPKFDALVRTRPVGAEIGFLEVGKENAASFASKVLKDCAKLVSQGMRAAIVRNSKVSPNWRAHRVVGVQISGNSISLHNQIEFANSTGFVLRIYEMSYGGGLFTVLARRQPIQLPQDYDPVAFRQLLDEAATLRVSLLDIISSSSPF